MRFQQDLEEKIKLAVKAFACSMHSGSRIQADMSLLVKITALLPLSNLEYWERFVRWEYFHAMASLNQQKSTIHFKPSPMLTWIDLISGDGFKREKTLQAITGAVPNSFFFALVIRRLNDWVPQVRSAARKKLPQLALESDPKHVVEALCATLPHWNTWLRMDVSDKQILLEIMGNTAITGAFKSKLISATSGPMVSIFAQLGRTPVFDTHLNDIAKHSIQPSVRGKAYRSLLEGKMVWSEGWQWEWTDVRYCKGRFKPILSERKLTDVAPFVETLTMASIDRSSIVRNIAAEMLIRNLTTLGGESVHLAQRFAADTSRSVAERGNFILKCLEAQKPCNGG